MTLNRYQQHMDAKRRVIVGEQLSVIDKASVRDCVLPDYDGNSDEHVLAGMVTGNEALELYKTHYENLGDGTNQEVFGVSPADIVGLRGLKKVWLPVLYGFGQVIKVLKVEVVHLKKEAAQLRGELSETLYALKTEEQRHQVTRALVDDGLLVIKELKAKLRKKRAKPKVKPKPKAKSKATPKRPRKAKRDIV